MTHRSRREEIRQPVHDFAADRGAYAGAPLSTSAPRPALCSVRSSAFGLALDDRATPGVAVQPLHLASRPPTRVGGGEKCSPSRVRTSGLDRCDDSARSAQRARREVLTRRKKVFIVRTHRSRFCRRDVAHRSIVIERAPGRSARSRVRTVHTPKGFWAASSQTFHLG